MVVHQDPLLDDHEVIGLLPLVVPTAGGEGTRRGAIGEDVHEVGAVAELPERVLRRREEAGAGVVGLESVGAVELGGMRDGLVDGEPEV